jgi:hypothetical protein
MEPTPIATLVEEVDIGTGPLSRRAGEEEPDIAGRHSLPNGFNVVVQHILDLIGHHAAQWERLSD